MAGTLVHVSLRRRETRRHYGPAFGGAPAEVGAVNLRPAKRRPVTERRAGGIDGRCQGQARDGRRRAERTGLGQPRVFIGPKARAQGAHMRAH